VSSTTFLATTPGPHGGDLWVTVIAPTWFDARAYAVRHFASLGEYVDAMSLACVAEWRPGMRGQAEVAWRGEDYSGSRRLWVRTRDKRGRWRPWVLA
jgi:hypothetical protein